MAQLVSLAPAFDGRSTVNVSPSSGITNGDVVTGLAPRRPNQNELLSVTRPPVGDEGRFGGNPAFTNMAAWNTTNQGVDTTLSGLPATNWLL
jgi:hypothetical protein